MLIHAAMFKLILWNIKETENATSLTVISSEG
jgi:hypothetical protein